MFNNYATFFKISEKKETESGLLAVHLLGLVSYHEHVDDKSSLLMYGVEY